MNVMDYNCALDFLCITSMQKYDDIDMPRV